MNSEVPAPADPHGVLERVRGRLIVSCQAGPDSPLNSPGMIAALAQSAERGGAAGFRIDLPANVAAVRAASALPILGINKRHVPGFEVFITPTIADALEVIDAGADFVAIDATARPRPNGETFEEIVRAVHARGGTPVMADVSTYEEGIAAAAAGADLVGTTLAGYTSYSGKSHGPDIELARSLARDLPGTGVVVEGRVWTVEELQACFEAGVHSVVIGSAITVPEFITRRFVEAIAKPVDASAEVVSANALGGFREQLVDRLARLLENSRASVDEAGSLIASAITTGHRVGIFDSGHLVSRELVARTGGLVAFTRIEIPTDGDDRFDRALDEADIRSGGVTIIGSVSGTGTDVVDLANRAHERGAMVIAVTASAHSLALEPNHPSGKRLLDVADLVLDNGAPYGDAFFEFSTMERRVVPMSGIGAVSVLWAAVVTATDRLLADGIEPSVYRSVHLPGGPADVEFIEGRYSELGH